MKKKFQSLWYALVLGLIKPVFKNYVLCVMYDKNEEEWVYRFASNTNTAGMMLDRAKRELEKRKL